MKVFYEPQAIKVWIHPTGVAAVVGLAGPVDDSEASELAAADRSGATWATAEIEGSEPDQLERVLALHLRGESRAHAVALRFAVRQPSTKLLSALRIRTTDHGDARLALFTDPQEMKRLMRKLEKAAGDQAISDLDAAALYFGHFRIEEETLGAFST